MAIFRKKDDGSFEFFGVPRSSEPVYRRGWSRLLAPSTDQATGPVILKTDQVGKSGDSVGQSISEKAGTGGGRVNIVD